MLRTLFILLFVAAAMSAPGQFYKQVLPSPQFTNAMEQIVRDFRHNFNNISGEKLFSQGEVDNYESSITLPGTIKCTINRYHSVEDTTASWHALMYQGEDYNEAVRIYKNTFRMVQKSRMKQVDRSLMGFTGTLQEPGEAVRFASSSLVLDVSDDHYKYFEAAIELIASYNGFEVNLSFHKKMPDTYGGR